MATKKWYDEIKNYNFTKGAKISEKGEQIGHFTQVVWKGTNQVGFGSALDEAGCIHIVAFYYPYGNVVTYALFFLFSFKVKIKFSFKRKEDMYTMY